MMYVYAKYRLRINTFILVCKVECGIQTGIQKSVNIFKCWLFVISKDCVH